jgi:hypothetical protein
MQSVSYVNSNEVQSTVSYIHNVLSVSEPPQRLPTGLMERLELELNNEKIIGTLHKVDQQ